MLKKLAMLLIIACGASQVALASKKDTMFQTAVKSAAGACQAASKLTPGKCFSFVSGVVSEVWKPAVAYTVMHGLGLQSRLATGPVLALCLLAENRDKLAAMLQENTKKQGGSENVVVNASSSSSDSEDSKKAAPASAYTYGKTLGVWLKRAAYAFMTGKFLCGYGFGSDYQIPFTSMAKGSYNFVKQAPSALSTSTKSVFWHAANNFRNVSAVQPAVV